MKKQLHYAVTIAILLVAVFQIKTVSATDGTGIVTVTANGGSCVGFTPAQGSGPDNWEVAEGGSYTMTITGVTECDGDAITVFIQSSNSGNFCFNATGGSGTYVGTFTIPNPTCNTMPISYKCGADQPCDNADTYNANGQSDNHKVHLRASKFDGSCNKTETDEDCSGAPCGLSISGLDIDVSCHGENAGLIDLSVSGAQGSVSYLWNDGSTDEDRSGLEPGTYSVTAKDDEGCEYTVAFTITEPDALNIEGSEIDVSITNGLDGSIDVTVTGGTSPYTYLWNDGAITEDRSGLPAGTYTVTVTDDHDCTQAETFTVNEPQCELSVSGTTVDATCHKANDGSIDITVAGAQGDVTYLWSDGSTDGDRTGLGLGTYSVTVTDEGSCQASEAFTINAPAAIKAKITVISNNGSCQAPCALLSTPYNADYTYKWKLNGQVAPGPHSSNTYCACISGSYKVKVTSITTGCQHTSKDYVVNITQKLEAGDQIPLTSELKFSAWPNPVQDNLNITIGNHLEGNVRIQLLDMFGRVISAIDLNGSEQGTNAVFNVRDLPSGIYIVSLINGTSSEEQKVILNK